MNATFAFRFKSARILNGIKVMELVDILGVSKQMISKYENGMSIPDGPNLIKIANFFKVKPDYFFTPVQISFDSFKFRKKSKTKQSRLESIKVNILNQMENYLLIEDILSIDSHYANPKSVYNINHIDQVENIADQLRTEWNIGDDPISSVVNLLEEKGFKIVEIDENMETSFDGLSVFVNDDTPVIVVNKNYDIERKRFTLLHELGHLLLQYDDKLTDKEVERLCDRFAGAILLPKSKLLNLAGKNRKNISLTELISIQKQYGISIPAIMYRLVSLGIFDNSKIKSFYIKQNQDNEFKRLVNESRYYGNEKSSRFNSLVYKALSQEIISISKASSLLNTDIESLRNNLTLI